MLTRYKPQNIFKLLTITLFFASVGISDLSAQFTITAEDIEQNFVTEFSAEQRISTDTVDILNLVETSGENQTWDFSTLDFEESLTGNYHIYEEISGLPESDDPHFAEATHASRMQLNFTGTYSGVEVELFLDAYTYAILNENELVSLGGVLTQGASELDIIDDEESITYLDPGKVELKFPLTYESSWEYQYESEINTLENNFTHDYQMHVVADSWGEIVTEEGSENVLRLNITETEIIGGTEFEHTRFSFINELGLEVASITGFSDDYNPEEDELEATHTSYSTSTSNELVENLPTDFTLEQNYPNPFNPSTVISYQLPVNSRVDLEVFDMTGRKVATLLQDEAKTAGNHSITFDADGLSSGTYIYSLTTGNTVITKKLTLIK